MRWFFSTGVSVIIISISVVSADSLDWRDYQDGDWTTPVGDQARYGHCWAFAAIGIVESQVKIAANDPDLPVDLSEQILQSCVFDARDRWFMDPIFDFLRDEGTVDEACFPLVDEADPPLCSDKCSDWAQRVTKIDEWQWLFEPYQPPPNVVQMMKDVLLDGPIGARITVYRDLSRDYEGGIYIRNSDEQLGDHFVVLVGYDDTSTNPDERFWIAKSSWGQDWGEDGFFRIRMGTNEAGIEEQIAQALIYPGTAPDCTQSGVQIELTETTVHPGDLFGVTGWICNTGDLPPDGLFTAVLDVGIGEYWFYPTWAQFPTDIEFEEIVLEDGLTAIDIISEFTWPDTGQMTMDGIRIYGAVLNSEFSAILGQIGVGSFGFGPN